MQVAAADPADADRDARPRRAWQRRLVGLEERGGEVGIGEVVLDGAQSDQPTPPTTALALAPGERAAWLTRGTGLSGGEQLVRAARCNEYGPPESITVEDVPEPALRSGDVLVEVRAASVNYPDVLVV